MSFFFFFFKPEAVFSSNWRCPKCRILSKRAQELGSRLEVNWDCLRVMVTISPVIVFPNCYSKATLILLLSSYR